MKRNSAPVIAVPSEAEARALALALRGRWDDALQQGLDWYGLLKAARSQRVAPLLYGLLRRDGHVEQVPVEVLEQLVLHYRRTQIANVFLLDKTLRDVLTRLRAVGIPAIVLKGAALTELVYENIGLRPMGDLDLLLHSEDVDRALATLHIAGYTRAGLPELRPGFDRQFRVEAELSSPGAVSCHVEPHWHLVGPLFVCRHVDYDAVWQRAEPVTLAGQAAYVLGPEDWVLHQVAHAVYKHRHVGLLDLCDVDRLVRYLGDRLDWQALLEIGAEFGWLPALAVVLSQASTVFETPVPGWVIERAAAFRLPLPDRWQMRWWLKPARPERHHIVPDFVTLPGLGARLRFIWAYLFPSRAYIEACYPGRAAYQLPFLYLHRLWSEAVQITRAKPERSRTARGQGEQASILNLASSQVHDG